MGAFGWKQNVHILERIYSQVEIVTESGCHIFTGVDDGKGYGLIKHNGKTNKVHRIVFEEFKGSAKGFEVAHRCDVRSCVNPDHLFLASHSENMADLKKKGKGKSGKQKLTENDVRFILESKENGSFLAKKFGVSDASISRVRNRICFVNVKV